MILDSATITKMATSLAVPPLGADHELIRAVWRVLEHGNHIHPDDNTPASEHLEAAIRHLSQDGDDPETKQPCRAHACARILLALFSITRR